MAATPAASPSMLSSRLNALVTPTIHTNASSRSSSAQPVTAIGGISHNTSAATAICPHSFGRGLTARMSSNTPSANINPE
jgi:hypothetical protein